MGRNARFPSPARAGSCCCPPVKFSGCVRRVAMVPMGLPGNGAHLAKARRNEALNRLWKLQDQVNAVSTGRAAAYPGISSRARSRQNPESRKTGDPAGSVSKIKPDQRILSSPCPHGTLLASEITGFVLFPCRSRMGISSGTAPFTVRVDARNVVRPQDAREP